MPFKKVDSTLTFKYLTSYVTLFIVAGWIIQMIILPKEDQDGLRLISGSEDATIRIWDLDSGDCLTVLEQDAGISCMLMTPRPGYQERLVFFGDQVLTPQQ